MADDDRDFTPIILAAAEWYATRGDAVGLSIDRPGGPAMLFAAGLRVTLFFPGSDGLRWGRRVFGVASLAEPGDLGEHVRRVLDDAAAEILAAPSENANSRRRPVAGAAPFVGP